MVLSKSHDVVMVLKSWVFKYYWIVYVTAVALAIMVVGREGVTKEERDFYFVVLGGVFALMFFIQKQKLEETSLFREFFESFNKRYDDLNDDLESICVLTGGNLTLQQKQKIVDYFNLCAEEYYIYKQGYLPLEVWEAWVHGIKYYFKNENFRAVWLSEKNSLSYYGFDPDNEIKRLT